MISFIYTGKPCTDIHKWRRDGADASVYDLVEQILLADKYDVPTLGECSSSELLDIFYEMEASNWEDDNSTCDICLNVLNIAASSGGKVKVLNAVVVPMLDRIGPALLCCNDRWQALKNMFKDVPDVAHGLLRVTLNDQNENGKFSCDHNVLGCGSRSCEDGCDLRNKHMRRYRCSKCKERDA